MACQQVTRPRAKRARRDVETPDYIGFVRRAIRAAGRRVAMGDPVELAELVEAQREMERVVRDAVRAMREHHGYSWAEIAAELNLTRQGAYQRYGRP